MKAKKKGILVLVVVTLLIASINVAFAADDDFPVLPFVGMENTQ